MFKDARRILLVAVLLLLLPLTTFAQSGSPCPRPAPGSVVTAPPELSSQNGTLTVTFNYFTTVDGDNDPTRPLAVIHASAAAPPLPVTETAAAVGSIAGNRFANLATATPTASRTLYFSEVLSDPSNPASPTNFFITGRMMAIIRVLPAH